MRGVSPPRFLSQPTPVPGGLAAPLLLCALLACGAPPGEEEPPTPGQDGRFDLGEERLCAEPWAGINRFSEEAESRGLHALALDGESEARGEPPPPGGGTPTGPRFALASAAIVAADIDLDGDIDLVGAEQTPLLLLNDGNGYFEQAAAPPSVGQDGRLFVVLAADLNGDRLPELVGAWKNGNIGDGGDILVWDNLGDAQFAEPRTHLTGLYGPGGDPSSLTVGDADGDGDLDLMWVTSGQVPELGGGMPDRLFINEGGRFETFLSLSPYPLDSTGVISLVATFTDRDGDGDQDLFIVGGDVDQPGVWPPTKTSAFWRNDGTDAEGLPVLVNDAEATGSDLTFSAMGIDSYDFNEDGQLDYCMTDVGRPQCLVSDGQGGWYEAALVLGLDVADPILEFPVTIGWAIDHQDLDNDGWPETIHASAPDHGGIWEGATSFPDLLWQGQPDRSFVDVTAEADFGDHGYHIGMVVADLDSNGFLDVFYPVSDPDMESDDVPTLLMNRCGTGSWLALELVGAPENTDAFGARVVAEFGQRTVTREMYSLRGTAQNPSAFHFGLGSHEQIDRLTVHWPDGEVTRLTNAPSRRSITAFHPDSE
ncbi:MAG: CRTAC1 family protein [Myxococcota bacterium]|nr:CRTAC1 family protein [Myxococcota bacterium]